MKTLLSILLLFPILITAQQFQVFEIDTSEYPKMKAKFYLTDTQDNPIVKHSLSDFEIKENGVLKEGLSVSCSPNTVSPMSIVIAVDVSGSMSGSYIQMVTTALNSFISNLDFKGSEIAITGFTTNNYFISDFTSNKNKILDKIRHINASGGTDFNSAFIQPTAGAILAMDKAAYSNKQIILITDGEANGNEQQIIKDASESNIIISTIVVDSKFPKLITNITEKTGGELFSNKRTSIEVYNALNKVTKQLLLNACTLEWKSNYICDRTVDLNIRNKKTNTEINKSIYLNENQSSKLMTNEKLVFFGDVDVNSKKDTTITFVATNKDVTINHISFVPDFGVFSSNLSLPYTIKKGESLDIKATFSPSEKYKYYSIMHVETSECKNEVGLVGGNSGYAFKQNSINVIYPKGGEQLVAGDIVEIKWDGVTEYDLVSISYSTNNGSKWIIIEEKYSGNTYNWKVPNTVSKDCKIRINHLNAELKHTIAGEVEWMKTLGGSSYEEIKKVIQTNDGGFLLVGNTSSDDGDFPKKNMGISEDCLILKIDAIGNIEWSKTYGGTRRDFAIDVMEEKDGEFTVLCQTNSVDGDVITTRNLSNFNSDVWVLRLNSNGEILKQFLYGSNSNEFPKTFIKTYNNEYIVVGASELEDNYHMDGNRGKGIYILKFDSLYNGGNGGVTGGRGEEYAVGVREERDGTIRVYGNVIDSDWPSNGHYTSFSAKLNEYGSIIEQGMYDLRGYIYKVYSDGYAGQENSTAKKNLSISRATTGNNWTVNFGSEIYNNVFGDVSEIKYYGYIAASMADKSSTSNYELYSTTISKFTLSGVLEWEKTISTDSLGSDFVNSIISTNDKGYLFAGYTEPLISNPYPYLGKKDIWIAKLSGEVTPLQSVISNSTFEIQMPKPSIKLKEFNLGDAVVGQSKMVVIEDAICNRGKTPLHILSIDVTGGDTLDFNISEGGGQSVLNYYECTDLKFEITPTDRNIRNAVVSITTTSGIYKDTFSLECTGTYPQAQTTDYIDFGTYQIGEIIDTSLVLIKNTYNVDLVLTKTNIVGPDMSQFEILEDNGSNSIPRNGSKTYSLRFTPKLGGRTSSIIEFHYDGVGSPMRTVLFAEGIGGEVYPEFKDVSLDEVAELQIFLKNISPKIIQNDEIGYKVKVQFDPTVIAPTDGSISIKSAENNSYFEYSGNLTEDNQIASIPMLVMKTNASESVIVIPEFQLYSSTGVAIDYDIEPRVCIFKVKNPQVNESESDALKLLVSPNVISSTASISVILIEAGLAELALFDNTGRKLEVLLSGNQQIGNQDINIDMSNYQSGRYYLQLTTPTITKTEFIEVIR